ncbi:hypothetical protein PR202_gb28896 [Eleusine coracana subsp. coracana]|uniref:WPP domain-associated protein n=1 Tax=Eleusine coracana subsp. coracana TaxID=191504 RepID=A0AAV5FY79_ELECO|nr:hypothetical protein PR202_gb28896 [Eleusine coracana subsp. coracana]
MAESLDAPPIDINGNDTVDTENMSFLDDIDSWVDEMNAGLHFSRSVTDVILKGILSDVHQEATRQIASKDSEIALLDQKLKQLENGNLSFPDGRDKRYDEFHDIRQQLDSISKSLLNSEWGLSGSHHNSEGSEDVNKQRGKEQSSGGGMPKVNGCKASDEDVFGDPVLLKHMDKDDLIAHFNKEMNKMKRHHDSVVQENTEEIFKLKRQVLKNEGPSWHLRNNKELEQMRKKIEEVISKLDVLLMESKRHIVRIKSDAFSGQQDQSSVADSDVKQLQGSATNDKVEHCSIPTQALYSASIEADHEKHIKRLQSDIEDAIVGVTIREEIEKIVVEEFVGEVSLRLHGHEMALAMRQEVCSIIQSEAIAQAMSNVDSLLSKYNKKKGFAEEESLQKEKVEKLKLIVDKFTEVVKEKEEYVSQVGLGTIESHVASVCCELDFLRDKVGKQDIFISEKCREFDTIVSRLEQSMQHVQHNADTLSELNDRFRSTSDSLKQLEKQNQVLRSVVEEKEKALTSVLSKDMEFNEFKEHVVETIRKFEEFIIGQQSVVANKVQHTESRFCFLKEQCKHLTKEGNLLRKKALRYKEISETRGSNLQKAELEVDLLGDEVEALTNLLAKIYIALDHYSPVLQHYTGVSYGDLEHD